MGGAADCVTHVEESRHRTDRGIEKEKAVEKASSPQVGNPSDNSSDNVILPFTGYGDCLERLCQSHASEFDQKLWPRILDNHQTQFLPYSCAFASVSFLLRTLMLYIESCDPESAKRKSFPAQQLSEQKLYELSRTEVIHPIPSDFVGKGMSLPNAFDLLCSALRYCVFQAESQCFCCFPQGGSCSPDSNGEVRYKCDQASFRQSTSEAVIARLRHTFEAVTQDNPRLRISAQCQVVRAGEDGLASADDFRKLCERCLVRKGGALPLLVNFDTKTAGLQDVAGHFSPIVRYHKGTDSVLLLDINTINKPCWIPVRRLYSAVDTCDGDVRRGCISLAEFDVEEEVSARK